MNKKTKETVIDKDTGEVLSVTETVTERVTLDMFVQVYLNDLSRYYCIKTELENKVLGLLWKDSFPYQDGEKGNQIIIVKSVKQRWAKEIGCKVHSIENILSKFLENELLIKDERATYFLNPKLYFKGKLSSRTKAINVLHKYIIVSKENEDEKI